MPTGIYKRKKGFKHSNASKEKMRQRMLKEWKEGKGKGFKKGNNLGKDTAGANHGNWKGGIRFIVCRKTIYKFVRIGVRQYQFEHRLIMEKYLGRKLLNNEVVHHKDGNGLNNSIDNLEVLKWGEHKGKHKGSYKHPNFICKCGNNKHFSKNMCKKCYYYEYHKNH
jgi:hypothetical protein